MKISVLFLTAELGPFAILRDKSRDFPRVIESKINFSASTYLTHYRPAMQFGKRKKYFRRSCQFSVVIKKCHPSGSLKFNN